MLELLTSGIIQPTSEYYNDEKLAILHEILFSEACMLDTNYHTSADNLTNKLYVFHDLKSMCVCWATWTRQRRTFILNKRSKGKQQQLVRNGVETRKSLCTLTLINQTLCWKGDKHDSRLLYEETSNLL
uniref:Uncharacterized protein n=1 Tax=Cacopsylla melanoneura TaxID=428564 RepID=A0A8D8ZB20_9HEMI